MVTIQEEENEDLDQNENSQDSDGFKAPAPLIYDNRYKNKNMNKFFNKNLYSHRPMEVTEGRNLRFVHEATMPSHLARQDEVRRVMR